MNDMSHTQPSTSEAEALPLTAVATQSPASRMEVMQRLHQNVRLNEYKLPTTAYQPDQLPPDLFSRPPEQQSELLHLASSPILYEEGLPVVDGRLYWEQLPWEPQGAYAYFTQYRMLQATYGYRSLNLLTQRQQDTEPTPEEIQADTKVLQDLRQHYIYYAWGYRVKAFDMVAHVAYDRLRERRAMDTENYHYLQLDNMFKQVKGHWDALNAKKGDSDPWADIGLVDTMKLLKDVMGLQRVSAGMPAATPLTAKEIGNDSQRGHSMETRLRHHAKQQALLEEGQSSDTGLMDELLKNPEMLAMAQKLILANTKGNTLDDNAEGVDSSDTAAQEIATSQIVPARGQGQG